MSFDQRRVFDVRYARKDFIIFGTEEILCRAERATDRRVLYLWKGLDVDASFDNDHLALARLYAANLCFIRYLF